MRSLKKALSLVLVLALMLSLCIFGASAASEYTDNADIQYAEAVDVLSAIEVIGGMGDGTFNPKGTLTRAQAAKIVSYLMLGSDTSKLTTGGSTFTDVLGTNDAWAAPYIEYCVTADIIGGYGDGRFGPADPLTGFAFAKMLLCALGYDAAIESYSGEAWSINVASDVIDAGLDEGLPGGFNYNAPLTREEACQMAFNALKANMVEYDTKGTTIVTGDGTTVVTGASKAEPKYDTKGASYAKNIGDDNIIQFGEYYFQDLKLTDEGKADDFGRPANTWKLKTAEIGTYVDSEDLVATYNGKVTLGTLYSLIGKTSANDIEDNANNDGDENTLQVYIDGYPVETTGTPLTADYFDSGNSNTFASLYKDGGHMGAFIDATGAGSYTEVYQDDDNNVSIVVINEYLVQAISDYNANKEELKVELKTGSDFTNCSIVLSEDDLDIDDVDVAGYVEDDYIIVSMAYDSSKSSGTKYAFEVQTVKPATLVEGKVDFINKNVNKVEFGSVTIDGTSYNYGLLANEDDGYAASYAVNEAAIVVTNDDGFILFVDDATAVDKYLFVYDFGSDGSGMDRVGNDKADAFFIDGTDAVITIDEVKDQNGDKVADPKTEYGSAWFSYSVGSDNKYDLKYVPTTKVDFGASKDVTVNGKTAFIDGVTKNGNKETVIILNDKAEDDTTLYTGATNAPDVATGAASGDKASVYYTTKDNEGKILKYVFVKAEGNVVIDEGTTTNADYTYILWNDGTGTDAEDNNYVMVETLQNSGEWMFMNVNETDWNPAACFSLVYKVKTNSDGYVTDWTSFADVADADDAGKQSKFEDFYFNAFAGQEIKVSKGTLDFGDDSLDISAADIYLIIVSAGNEDLVNDPGVPADFTNMHISGSQLKNALSGYAITGTVAGVRADENSDSMSAVYVTVFASAAV